MNDRRKRWLEHQGSRFFHDPAALSVAIDEGREQEAFDADSVEHSAPARRVQRRRAAAEDQEAMDLPDSPPPGWPGA